ncbi:hypothetical protein VTJ04DRAFT_1245 [Mycothermus thermophilus]|uniref:uncharacterized protein n=1 Tax=Humicola insolens TaxID=85995 RepID=UPI0037438E8F
MSNGYYSQFQPAPAHPPPGVLLADQTWLPSDSSVRANPGAASTSSWPSSTKSEKSAGDVRISDVRKKPAPTPQQAAEKLARYFVIVINRDFPGRDPSLKPFEKALQVRQRDIDEAQVAELVRQLEKEQPLEEKRKKLTGPERRQLKKALEDLREQEDHWPYETDLVQFAGEFVTVVKTPRKESSKHQSSKKGRTRTTSSSSSSTKTTEEWELKSITAYFRQAPPEYLALDLLQRREAEAAAYVQSPPLVPQDPSYYGTQPLNNSFSGWYPEVGGPSPEPGSPAYSRPLGVAIVQPAGQKSNRLRLERRPGTLPRTRRHSVHIHQRGPRSPTSSDESIESEGEIFSDDDVVSDITPPSSEFSDEPIKMSARRSRSREDPERYKTPNNSKHSGRPQEREPVHVHSHGSTERQRSPLGRRQINTVPAPTQAQAKQQAAVPAPNTKPATKAPPQPGPTPAQKGPDPVQSGQTHQPNNSPVPRPNNQGTVPNRPVPPPAHGPPPAAPNREPVANTAPAQNRPAQTGNNHTTPRQGAPPAQRQPPFFPVNNLTPPIGTAPQGAPKTVPLPKADPRQTQHSTPQIPVPAPSGQGPPQRGQVPVPQPRPQAAAVDPRLPPGQMQQQRQQQYQQQQQPQQQQHPPQPPQPPQFHHQQQQQQPQLRPAPESANPLFYQLPNANTPHAAQQAPHPQAVPAQGVSPAAGHGHAPGVIQGRPQGVAQGVTQMPQSSPGQWPQTVAAQQQPEPRQPQYPLGGSQQFDLRPPQHPVSPQQQPSSQQVYAAYAAARPQPREGDVPNRVAMATHAERNAEPELAPRATHEYPRDQSPSRPRHRSRSESRSRSRSSSRENRHKRSSRHHNRRRHIDRSSSRSSSRSPAPRRRRNRGRSRSSSRSPSSDRSRDSRSERNHHSHHSDWERRRRSRSTDRSRSRSRSNSRERTRRTRHRSPEHVYAVSGARIYRDDRGYREPHNLRDYKLPRETRELREYPPDREPPRRRSHSLEDEDRYPRRKEYIPTSDRAPVVGSDTAPRREYVTEVPRRREYDDDVVITRSSDAPRRIDSAFRVQLPTGHARSGVRTVRADGYTRLRVLGVDPVRPEESARDERRLRVGDDHDDDDDAPPSRRPRAVVSRDEEDDVRGERYCGRRSGLGPGAETYGYERRRAASPGAGRSSRAGIRSEELRRDEERKWIRDEDSRRDDRSERRSAKDFDIKVGRVGVPLPRTYSDAGSSNPFVPKTQPKAIRRSTTYDERDVRR